MEWKYNNEEKPFGCSDLVKYIYKNTNMKPQTNIYTNDGLIKTAYDYNEYLLINSNQIISLYEDKLYWWQKLLLKVIFKFKNKKRKEFERLCKDRILDDIKENEGGN